jgi:beta-phosphoglucomutase
VRRPAVSAVIFDFDGVLADTERLHLRAFQSALAEFGWTLDEPTYFRRYVGYDDRETFARFAADRGLPLDSGQSARLLAAKSAAYRGHLTQGSALFPHTRACIDRLRGHFPLAIASGSLHAEIEDILRGAGLADAFVAIVGADEVSRGKPAPDLYLEATRRLGIDAARGIAVEDSVWGLEAARAAGLRTIAVTTSYPAESLRAHANEVIASLDELTAASLLCY